MPTVSVKAGVNSTNTNLRTKSVCYLGNQLRAAQCGTVYAHLVSSGIEKPLYVCQFVYSASNSEGNVYLRSYAGHHFRECLAPLETCRYVKENKFVSSGITVCLTQFYGVSCMAKVNEVCAFYRLSVLYVKAWYYSLCQSVVL